MTTTYRDLIDHAKKEGTIYNLLIIRACETLSADPMLNKIYPFFDDIAYCFITAETEKEKEKK